jgi:IclR family transcriptional regulator, acetate operon repressor
MNAMAAADYVGPGQSQRNPVAKALLVLEWLVKHPSDAIGVREMAAVFGWTPSTLHRILVLLENERWISSENGRYRLGLRFFNVALTAARDFPLLEVAMSHIEELVRETDETTLLGLFDPNRLEMTFVAAVESRQALRYAADLRGTFAPLHAGAAGLAILAFLSQGEQQRAMRRGLEAVTDRTIVDPERLQEVLLEVREQGYACTTGERTTGCSGIAAPILGPSGRVLGDVVLNMPDSRFESEREQELAAAVMRCACAISTELEGTGQLATASGSS